MLRLKAKGLKWLKGFHLIAVSCWFGGGIALVLLQFLKDSVTNGNVLYGINQSIHHIDMGVIVIPGALGCFITGIIYSSFSNWGFFKHRWMSVKWIIYIIASLAGVFFLGPWETAMVEISGKLGISSLDSPDYLYYEKMFLIFSVFQMLILIALIFISIFKPWKVNKDKRTNQNV